MMNYFKKFVNGISYSQYPEFKRYFRIYSNNTLRYLVSKPEEISVSGFHRVLVLSPHLDDDVIASGGTIAKCVEGKVPVKVVYLTNGNQRKLDQGDNPSVRIQEAKDSMEFLGCTDFQFLSHHQNELIINKDAWKDILQILIEYKPDAIFTPSFFEKNVDHYATSLILAQALAKSKVNATCFCYEIWAPSMINSYVDISDVVERKICAINKHQSQILTNNYADKILALNRYRSLSTGNNSTCCEAYWKCSSKEFIKIKTLSESYLK